MTKTVCMKYTNNLSIKSIVVKTWSSIYTNPIHKSIYTKKKLIVWLDYSTSLKTLLFFSFNKVHIKYKRLTLHSFSRRSLIWYHWLLYYLSNFIQIFHILKLLIIFSFKFYCCLYQHFHRIYFFIWNLKNHASLFGFSKTIIKTWKYDFN